MASLSSHYKYLQVPAYVNTNPYVAQSASLGRGSQSTPHTVQEQDLNATHTNLAGTDIALTILASTLACREASSGI